jgi:isoquinoline 1-oxidoreductase alpha subunit
MNLLINGETYEIPDNTEAMLLWVLRDELGLMGTKYGCGIGFCGSCTVLVDGRPVRSCLTPAASIAGKEITTIEGLAQKSADGEQLLHPVQQAFLAEQTPQCSWCMSGQMLGAVALLQSNPNPTDEEIVQAMNAYYCRCGAYGRIKKAVKRAATIIAEGEGA